MSLLCSYLRCFLLEDLFFFFHGRPIISFYAVQNLVMQNADHSAGDLINLLQGLLRYEPSDRLKAREALRHPFFTRGGYKRGGF